MKSHSPRAHRTSQRFISQIVLSGIVAGFGTCIGSNSCQVALGHGPHGHPHTHHTHNSSGKGIAESRAASTIGDRDARWYKGNIHTHSLWSDGDDFPEMISDWYRQRDYNFLAISDHNTLAAGQRWMKRSEVLQRGGKDILEKYKARFGAAWVETRGSEEDPESEIRLKPFDEYRYLLEQSESFILIPGEEVSDSFEGRPLHMNATNLGETLRPVGGSSMREAIENNVRQVLEQEKKLGREILMHLNHPNFHYAVTYEDLAFAVSEKFFEVYNGHPSVNHLGDDEHPSVERMWDLINHIRVNQLGYPPILGLGTDDSHNYHDHGGSRPGRGWIVVRSRYLTPEHLIRAIEDGDFYASSGVTLGDVQWDQKGDILRLTIEAKPNVTYKTDYIVIDRNAELEQVGRIAFSTEELTSEYKLQNEEIVVRAVVTSSETPDDPVFEGQKQQAWSQPFVSLETLEALSK